MWADPHWHFIVLTELTQDIYLSPNKDFPTDTHPTDRRRTCVGPE